MCWRQPFRRRQWEADAAGAVHDGVRCGTQWGAANNSVPRARVVALLVAVLGSSVSRDRMVARLIAVLNRMKKKQFQGDLSGKLILEFPF